MTASNYQTNSVDLDSTYIPGNDPNYIGIQSAVTNRKTVVFGQQLLAQLYPTGNINNAINYAQTLPGIQTDQDSTTITGVGPTAVFYKNRANTSQSLIRSNFLLLENSPQTSAWLLSTAYSSPVQIGTTSTWTQVSAGYYNNAAIQSNGTLWTWGQNDLGQTGINSTSIFSFPVQVGTLSDWSQVSTAARAHMIARKTDGTLWTWGLNTYGQLGSSNTTNRSSPAQVGAVSTWSQVACGYYQSAAIQSNGTLWTWGLNSQGQLGTNTSTLSNVLSPVQVGALTTWTQITMGYTATAAIQNNGTLWTWGSNQSGALGINTSTAAISSPVQVGALSNWTQIAGMFWGFIALQSNGTLWSWGYNGNGQLGLNTLTSISSPVQIGALTTWKTISRLQSSGVSAAAIQSNGTLWAWGYNAFGQLGTGNTTQSSSPVQVGTLSVWTQIACGYQFVSIQSNGSLWSWGLNTFGALGLLPSGISATKVTYGL